VLNNMPRLKTRSQVEALVSAESADFGMLPQQLFMRLLHVERKRTERSQRRFVLMLLDPGSLLRAGNKENKAKDKALEKVLFALSQSTRDTDITGWYKDGSVVGAIFTEVGDDEDSAVVKALATKVSDALYRTLTVGQINEIRLSFHVFPEDWNDDGPSGPANSTLHLDLARGLKNKPVALLLKRFMDIAGSLAALIVCLPVFAAIFIAIKMTSKGPVLFRQVRLGQYGKKFTFLKFRSMYYRNDHTIHEQYVKRLIAGGGRSEQTVGRIQYKLTADPRITPLGKFLRKTSLDELPQFFNVLTGEMSLVGPRPPVTYEFASYDLWHKQRLLAVKPGITGLWQVDGRSRMKFDDMVRLDIKYARSWSLWLDLKVLLQTPRAVLSGDGAC
jgi:lipopolysaccharide/colanic/teichoic acid biosynthesis glycosyltransferase